MLEGAADEVVGFGVDVTRGGILATLVDTPTLTEKMHQGGYVGYAIITLGIIGVLIALLRLAALSTAARKVNAQLKREAASTDNAWRGSSWNNHCTGNRRIPSSVMRRRVRKKSSKKKD